MFYRNTYCNEVYLEYLRKNGAVIGNNTRFINPNACHIDPGRMDYISIGDNCCLVYVTILAHDYSWYVFAEAKDAILPDPGGEVHIGNNCFIGYQACILKGTTIGNNVIIGDRAVVKGNIPDNTVWAGVPAKQICTLQELYDKKVKTFLDDAIRRRDFFRNKYHREPTIKEMGMFFFLFLNRSQENYECYIKNIEFNGVKDSGIVRKIFFESKPIIDSFSAFLKKG